MSKLYILSGISASGKSAEAINIANRFHDDKKEAIIVSRDKIRELLFGYTEESVYLHYLKDKFLLHKHEERVSQFQDTIIHEAILNGLDVIVDNTHLKMRYIKHYYNVFSQCEIEVKFIDCDLEEAIVRDAKRCRSVGVEVIRKQYNDYKNLRKIFDTEIKAYTTKPEPIFNNPELPHCVIFDIDGSLAHMDGRSPFDYSKVHTDKVDTTLRHFLDLSKTAYDTIFICSGREDSCRSETEAWLTDSKIYCDGGVMMRKSEDMRKDFIVKEEMWREICKTHYIRVMFDDRSSVINYGRRLGFTVYQVAEGNF